MANSVFLVVSLVAAMTTRAAAECSPSAEIGCLNGEAFDKSQQFICGASIDNRPAIYQSATISCCAQGIPFVKETSFCCYDGVHDRSTGSCKLYVNDQSFPASCNCYGGNTRLLSVARTLTDQDVVNTSAENPQDTCSGATENRGCLNGYYYDYSAQMPCGDYLVNVATHGCCPTVVGIKPYNLGTQSCCEVGESHEVLDGGRACSCSKCTTTTTTTSTTTTTTSNTTTTTSTTTTTTTTTTVPILTTRVTVGITLPPGQGANSTAFEEALARVFGVNAEDVEVESVSQRVNVTYNFSTNVSEGALRTAIADVLNVSVDSVTIVLEPDAYGNTHVTVIIEAESARAAGEVSTKAANATAVTAALAEYGVTANTTVQQAPTVSFEVNATITSETGTHVDTPTSDQLAQIGNELGATVLLKSVTHEEPQTEAATTTYVTSTTNAQVGSTLSATDLLSGSRRCFVPWFLLTLVLSAKAGC